MRLEFFMPMVPPKTTAQMHQTQIVESAKSKSGYKPRFYDTDDIKAARAKLTAHLGQHVPAERFTGPVRLLVKWCWPSDTHEDGEYKATKPDTDNLQKLLKDVMTRLGYWTDDAQVASEIVEKFWAAVPGIYVSIEELT